MRLVRWMLRATSPLWRRTLLYVPVALVPSLLLVAAAYGATVAAGVDPRPFNRSMSAPSLAGFAGSVVFAPVLETLLLAGVISLLQVASKSTVFVAVISAVIWGALHATLGVLAFFGTVWSFFVFSCAFLAWRKISFARAFVAAAVPHALCNATILSLALLLGVT